MVVAALPAVSSISLIVMLALILPDDGKDVQVCDAVVQTLLTTRDPIELQRAGILVDNLNCSVSRRAFPWLHDRVGVHPG